MSECRRTQWNPDSLARYGIGIIDRGIRKYRWKSPGLMDDMRSRAHLDLAASLPRALAHENPTGYVIQTVTNAFRQVARASMREWKRTRPYSDELAAHLVSPFPGPELIAMFREEMSREVKAPPKGYHVQPGEWDTFRRVVIEHPGLSNRELAAIVNRETGRKFNVFSVSRARRKMGI